jgi:hypothetical protein
MNQENCQAVSRQARMNTRNYGKDFDRYAEQAERNIDELEIDAIVAERLQRTGITPEAAKNTASIREIVGLVSTGILIGLTLVAFETRK